MCQQWNPAHQIHAILSENIVVIILIAGTGCPHNTNLADEVEKENGRDQAFLSAGHFGRLAEVAIRPASRVANELGVVCLGGGGAFR